jgi:hypothetical protein
METRARSLPTQTGLSAPLHCAALVTCWRITLGSQALLTELLLSGFFAIACFRARATGIANVGVAPRALFAMTDRLERLRRSRWQWFAMVLLLVVIRVERGAPMVAEVTVIAQLIVFLLLPTKKATQLAR